MLSIMLLVVIPLILAAWGTFVIVMLNEGLKGDSNHGNK